jgi:hypothetical protein
MAQSEYRLSSLVETEREDVYARFGQELYARETIAAAAVVARLEADGDCESLTARVAAVLPHRSAATRQRLATKLLQRMAAGTPACDALPTARAGAPTPAPSLSAGSSAESGLPPTIAYFARLLCSLNDTQARGDLIYYATARADDLVGAIARDILYPYFIEDRIPAPYGEDEFIMANAGLLLAPEPILTTGFVADYAQRVWGFESERTVGLALRILRQAGILLSAPLLGARGRVAAYTLAPHGLSLAALLWGLYDEFGNEPVAPAWDQVANARFARLFVVAPSVVNSRLWEAERVGLVARWSAGGTRRVALKVREIDALTRLMLAGPDLK